MFHFTRGKNVKKLFAVLVVSSIALAGFTTMAGATISFNLGLGNPALNPPFTGPYARVDVSLLNPHTAQITFISLIQGGNIYLLGDGGSVAVNSNGASMVS